MIYTHKLFFSLFGWFESRVDYYAQNWKKMATRNLLISIYCVSNTHTSPPPYLLYYSLSSFIIICVLCVCVCVCVCVCLCVWFSLVLICCACFFACVCVRCCVTHTRKHTHTQTHTHTPFDINISLCVYYMCIDCDRLWSDRLNLAGWMNATALR